MGHVPAWREEIAFRRIRFAAFKIKFDLSGKTPAGCHHERVAAP
jgi:hypothetical protein